MAPSWIAAALVGVGSLQVGRRRLMERLESLTGQYGLSAGEMWRQFRLLDRRAADSVDLRTVASRIRDGAIPRGAEICLLHGTLTILFDVLTARRVWSIERVILASSRPQDEVEAADEGEEVRVLSVGLSRAESGLLRP